MSPNDFLNKIEGSNKQPYTPINNPKEISEGLVHAFSQEETPFVNFFDYWIEKCSSFQNKYMLSESKSILEALQTSLSTITTTEQIMIDWIQLMNDDANQRMNTVCQMLSE